MRSLLLAMVLGGALAGCGDKGGGGDSSSPPSGGPPTSYAGSGGDGTDGAGAIYPGGHPITWLTTNGWTLGQEDRILDLVNSQRVSISVGALTMVLLMRQCSRGHSEHMSVHDFFAHTNPEADGPTQRYSKAGGAGGCGENIAAGYADADAAFTGWMNSPGHKTNIENSGYTKTGTGYSGNTIPSGPYTKIYAQMFQ